MYATIKHVPLLNSDRRDAVALIGNGIMADHILRSHSGPRRPRAGEGPATLKVRGRESDGGTRSPTNPSPGAQTSRYKA